MSKVEGLADLDGTKICRGVILKSVRLAGELIEKIKTKAGLSVKVNIIDKVYETGHKVSKQFKENMRILKDDYLPQWNYVAKPAEI
jgi:hypothetical protein